MVFDGARNRAYISALAKVITPETVVMDLGAGLGVHGLSAASLGAAAVHLVEPAPVLEAARKVAQDNDLANVHCHNCRVEELQLDEPVDVIVSVFTGNFLLTENLLPSLFHARDRCLASGGKMVPDRARMEVVPVCAPSYYREHVDKWSEFSEHASEHELPGLDYTSVRQYAANKLHYDTREAFQAAALGPCVELMELDLTTATSADCNANIEAEITSAGTCHGWLGWFQIHLGDEWLSTSGEDVQTHWRPVFLPLEQPLQVEAGSRLGFGLKRPEFGEWSWTTQHGEHIQRQSTFLSQPVTVERAARHSENFQPKKRLRGDAAAWLLPKMTGELPVSRLAIELFQAFPGAFATEADALQFTRELAERYC
jgi:predicted RNA methylase